MVPIIASHRRRLLQFFVVPLLPHVHKFFFQFPEQNMYWTIAPLRSAQIFLSNESSFAQNWFWTRELCPFHPSVESVPTNFRTRNVQYSCHISCTGLQIHWSWMRWNGNFMELPNINFLFLVHICPCAKFDENSGACSRTLEVLRSLISSLITNSWDRFVMPAKQFKCTIYPKGDSWE